MGLFKGIFEFMRGLKDSFLDFLDRLSDPLPPPIPLRQLVSKLVRLPLLPVKLLGRFLKRFRRGCGHFFSFNSGAGSNSFQRAIDAVSQAPALTSATPATVPQAGTLSKDFAAAADPAVTQASQPAMPAPARKPATAPRL